MKINEKIKFIREKHDLKQAEFGDIIGTAQKVVSNWESGKNDPSFDSIKAISMKFKVSPTWLIMDEYGIDDNSDDIDGLYFDAKGLAEECGQISDLVDTLKLFNVKYSFLVSVKNKAKTVGAQNFFIKLNDIFIDSGIGIQEVMTELIGFIVGKSIEVGPTMRDALVSSIAECSIFGKIDTKKREAFICWVDSEISDIEAFDLLTIFTTKWNIDHE